MQTLQVTCDQIPLQHALLATFMAFLASIVMTITSIMTLASSLVCDGLGPWTTTRSATPPSAARSHKAALPISPRSVAREAYRRDWQRLHFLEMSDSQLADFSPY